MIGRLDSRITVYWATVIFSGLISFYRTLSGDIINGDGILYIDVAKAFVNDGFTAAFEVFPWALYGVLIGLVHKISGLGFEISAYTLNAILSLIVCVTFVRIYEEITPRQSRIWVAAVLILALPILNDYRDMVIRGYGFWAFMMLALLYFIRYSKTPAFGNAIKWQLSIAVAILFRVEGIAFLVLAPFYFLFRYEGLKQTATRIIQLNSIFLCLLFAGVLAFLGIYGLPEFNETSVLGRWLSYASPGALVGTLDIEAGFLYERMQYLSSQGEAQLILVSGLLVLVAVKVAKNAEILFLAVWAYGSRQKWMRLEKESFIVILFAVIGLLTLISLTGSRFFLSSRYTVLTVLFLSLISFQYIDCLFTELARKGRGFRLWLAAAVVFLLFLDGVISQGAKGNIKEAGEWLKDESGIDGKIACNEKRLEFYSDGRCDFILLEEGSAAEISRLGQENDYLLLWVGRNHEQLKSVMEEDRTLMPVKKFVNKRGDAVVIYEVKRVMVN
jgi:hypothetical protein